MKLHFALCLLTALSRSTSAWVNTYPSAAKGFSRGLVAPEPQQRHVLHSDKFNRNLEERSMRNAKGGVGETAAGAVLGGLLFGPFGALFGAQIGSSVGAKNAVDRARSDEMQRMGVSQEMLDAAQDVGMALQQSMEGLEATQESLSTLQSIARRLDIESDEAYEKATEAVKSGDEEAARKYLFQKTQAQEKLKSTLIKCAEEKKRKEQMESNVEAIKTRAVEVEYLLQRSIGAQARQNSSEFLDLSLPQEDPLLRKFRDAGID